jgi:hypothetical protein
VLLLVDGWEDVTMGSKKPKTYTFTKNAWPHLTFCQRQSPWIILFYNNELLKNIVVETDRCMRQKIAELQLGLRFIWSGWSHVSS